MAKKNEIDITKTGPQGYKQLQEYNQSPFASIRPNIISLSDINDHAPQDVQSSLAKSATPWGASMFDNENANENEFQQLGDIRAENQPWYSKVGAGLAKGVVLAGTTFLDGTVGFLVGAVDAAANKDWSKLWDNDFSRAMKEVNDLAEREMPNYYTQDEQENPWGNIFSANFLGDKLIKNLGFMVGAFYSGGIYAGAAKGGVKLAAKGALKLGSTMSTAKNILKAAPIVGSVVGAGTSALNEGRIEALNNSTDWANHQKLMLDERHAQYLQAIKAQYGGTEMYDQMIASANEQYYNTLMKIEEDRAKMGNADLLMNLPVLMASNVIQWGKMFGEGLGTARRVNNIVKRAGKYETTLTTAGGVRKGFTNSLSEGTEEIAQKAASNISGIYYEGDVTNFHKSMMDPEAEQEHIDWSKAFAKGILETVKDPHAWEEFLIGTLSGALGMPSFGKANTKNAYIGKDRSFGFTGGLAGEIMENRELMQREQALVDYMNTRIQSPEFLNYYRGLIRHKKYQNDMDKAIEEGNGFDYKNAEYNQFVSDIIMFDNAGKLEDLKTLIGESFDTSDENLDAIVRNTTSIGPNGVLVGPFAQYAAKDTDGNIISNFGNEASKKEMVDKLTKKKDSMMQSIEEYSKAKFEIEELVGDKVSEEQLGELVWLKGAVENLSDRKKEMLEETKPTLQKLLKSLMDSRDYLARAREQEGTKGRKVKRGDKEVLDFSISDRYKELLKSEDNVKANIQFLEGLINGKFDSLSGFFANQSETVQKLKEFVNEIPEISATEAAEFSKKLDDIVKADKLSTSFSEKLTEYLKNPEKQVEDNQKAEAQVAEQGQQGARNAISARFNWNGNTSDIAKILEENKEDIETAGGMDKFMAQLTPEQRKKVREARKLLKGVSGLRSLIDDSDLSDEQKRIANSIIDDSSDSSNMEELANKISKLLKEGVVSQKFIDASNGAEVNDLANMHAVEEIEAKLKEFFEDNIAKAAKSADEAEKIQRRREKKAIQQAEKIAGKLSEEEAKNAAEEGEIDPSLIPEDSENSGDNINPTTVEELNKAEGKPTQIASPPSSSNKATKADTYRPQLTEFYMHGFDNETYADYIEKHPEAIPEGVDKDAYIKYIVAVTGFLKRSGAFTFVNGTDSNWKMEESDVIRFEHHKQLSEMAGVPVVAMIIEKDGKEQIVGTLPTRYEFESKSRSAKKASDGTFEKDAKGNYIWVTNQKTVGELRPEQKKLYEEVLNSSITKDVTEKDGVVITKFTEHRLSKDGTVKDVSIGGLKVSKNILDYLADDYKYTFSKTIDNIEDVKVSELRIGDGKQAGTILVKYKDQPGYVSYDVAFNSVPSVQPFEKATTIHKEGYFDTLKDLKGESNEAFEKQPETAQHRKIDGVLYYTGTHIASGAINAFRAAIHMGVLPATYKEVVDKAYQESRISAGLFIKLTKELKGLGITNFKELLEYIENNAVEEDVVEDNTEKANIHDLLVIPSIRTKVKSLRGGKVEYGKTRKSVSNIFGSETPVIAIVDDSGELSSGNTKTDQSIIQPLEAKPWQVYVMVPANNGMYLPAMCASIPLSDVFDNPNDWYVRETLEAFKKVVSSTKDMKENAKALYKWLNIPGLGVQVGVKKGNNWEQIPDVANATHVRVSFKNLSGKPWVTYIPIVEGQLRDDDIRDAINTMLKQNPNLTTNVDIKKLANPEYRANIAKYLITNIASSTPHTVNDWFTYEPTDIETGISSAKRAEELESPRKVVEHGAAKEVVVNGEKVIQEKDGTLRDVAGNNISVQLGEEISISDSTGASVAAPEVSSSFLGFGIGTSAQITTSESDRLYVSKKRRGRRMEITEETSSEKMSSKDRMDRDIAKIKKMFPQLSESGRIIVVSGLHAISDKGNAREVYGYFRDGILYINSNSPIGTAYHEAFHYVTDALLDESERKMLFEEAEKRYKMSDTLALEERLAEDFRDYMNGYEDKSLVGRLKTFFRNLKYIINKIAGNINYIDSLFHSIYKNGFSTRKENIEDNFSIQLMKYRSNKVAYERLSYDIQESLKAKGISKEDFNSLTIEGKEDLIFCLL